MSKYLRYSILYFLAFLLLSSSFYLYVVNLQKNSQKLKEDIYAAQALSMEQNVASLIEAKQKSTVAVAIAIAQNREFVHDLARGSIEENYFSNLINSIREHTLYKNIWIQVVDKNMISLHRSWSSKKGDSLALIRKDLYSIMESKQTASSISSGLFTLSIKAMVPVYFEEKTIGAVEVISHFNSISQQLLESKIYSVVVLHKERSKRIQFPFTKLFIKEYYVANIDAKKEFLDYLEQSGVANYLAPSRRVENGYLIVSQELKDNNGAVIATYITFKYLEDIEAAELDLFILESFVYGVGILFITILFGGIWLYYRSKKQKNYYKNIIDAAVNIVLITTKDEILQVNRTFFKYFHQYISLEEFKAHHQSIGELFMEESGCLHARQEGEDWIAYLLKDDSKGSRVKLFIDGSIYYFAITASLISEESEHYSVVLADVTEQENYKNELEMLTITDALTQLKNRRYFSQKMHEEISRTERYGESLSVIMMDIDHFKEINDKNGHDIGDRVLQEYALHIGMMLRRDDIFCRIGGEEFMIILPHTSLIHATELAHKLALSVREHKKIVNLTMSFGVAQYQNKEGMESLFTRVDKALYRAKEQGRDRVVVA